MSHIGKSDSNKPFPGTEKGFLNNICFPISQTWVKFNIINV